ncbi:hypothetical protein D3C76_1055740 [compost metagenome]
MVGGGAGQWCQAIGRFHPGLPETTAIGQAEQATVSIETRLLQRFLRLVAGHAARGSEAAIGLASGDHQTGRGPGLIRATPLNPGQSLRIGTQGRCGVKVRAFGQQMPRAIHQVDRHQAVYIAVFLYRQYLAIGELQITISTHT